MPLEQSALTREPPVKKENHMTKLINKSRFAKYALRIAINLMKMKIDSIAKINLGKYKWLVVRVK